MSSSPQNNIVVADTPSSSKQSEKAPSTGTASDVNGDFTLQLPAGDSSQLVARYPGYESKSINPSENKTGTLNPDERALSEVVVVGYGVQKKSAVTGSVASVSKSDSIQSSFGEKEFQGWCKQQVSKLFCDGKNAFVKVSFFIDETGKPSNIEYRKYTCEGAKEEMEKLLFSSPTWTEINRKVTVTIKWEK